MVQALNGVVWPRRSLAKGGALAGPLLVRVAGRHQIDVHQFRPLFAIRLRAHSAPASNVAFDVPLKALVRRLLADLPAIPRQDAGEVDLLRAMDSRRWIAATLRVPALRPLQRPLGIDPRRRRCRRFVARRRVMTEVTLPQLHSILTGHKTP